MPSKYIPTGRPVGRPKGPNTQSVRLPLKDIDRLRDLLTKDKGRPITRAESARWATDRAIEELERENQ